MSFSAIGRLIKELGCISISSYGPLEEWTEAGDDIEILCSYGDIHRFTVLYKRRHHFALLEKGMMEVVATESDSDHAVVLDSSMSDHYDAAWRFALGTCSLWPRKGDEVRHMRYTHLPATEPSQEGSFLY